MPFVAGLALLLACIDWAVWWGVLLARRGLWVPAVCLWLAALVLVVGSASTA